MRVDATLAFWPVEGGHFAVRGHELGEVSAGRADFGRKYSDGDFVARLESVFVPAPARLDDGGIGFYSPMLDVAALVFHVIQDIDVGILILIFGHHTLHGDLLGEIVRYPRPMMREYGRAKCEKACNSY